MWNRSGPTPCLLTLVEARCEICTQPPTSLLRIPLSVTDGRRHAALPARGFLGWILSPTVGKEMAE